MPGYNAFSGGHFALASCTRFSPNERWPAASTGRIAASPWVLVTATSVVEGAGLTALFRAASMRARMRASASAESDMGTDNLDRAQLARAAFGMKRTSAFGRLPPLVLMTDDERLPDPVAAARALPRGSLVVLRARQASHRAKLAAALMPVVRAKRLYLSISGDPELAGRIGAHGVHLPEARAREAARWRSLRPGWLITVA